MGIVYACAVPHPPLIIPAVGRGMEARIPDTVRAFGQVARETAAARPDAVILLTSHAPAFRDCFYVSLGGRAWAGMSRFDVPEEGFDVHCDQALSAAIAEGARRAGIPVTHEDPYAWAGAAHGRRKAHGGASGRAAEAGGAAAECAELDHASFIPLWFLRRALADAAGAAEPTGADAATGAAAAGADTAAVPEVTTAAAEPTGAAAAAAAAASGDAADATCAAGSAELVAAPAAAGAADATVPALPPIVRIGLSGLPIETHAQLGRVIARAVQADGRRTAVIASGDLSHRLLAEGPYGFRPEGPVFDRQVTDIFAEGELGKLLRVDGGLAEAAGECGWRPFCILAGILDGRAVDARLLSYEGPFGVGYAVASFACR